MVGIATGDRMILELAEMARERDVLGTRDVLIAEEEHAILEQQRADLRHQLRRARRDAEVHVVELGADCAGEGLHADRVQRGALTTAGAVVSSI